MTGMSTNQPISSHPAFRWAVGLWFAALLGAGLFVMPDTVHATIRQSLGIDGMLPGDVIGKAALAAGAGMFGLLLGLVLAGRVASLNAARNQDVEEEGHEATSWGEVEAEPVEDIADGPRRPFSPREFFGEGDDLDQIEPEPGGHDKGEEVVVEEIVVDEPPIELTEFEPVVEDVEIVIPPSLEVEEAAQADSPPEAELEPSDDTQALGDLPLSVLTQRLQHALDASRATADAPPSNEDGELDPVIAFLRREADRATPTSEQAGSEDAQAALRSALDRLSKVSNPR